MIYRIAVMAFLIATIGAALLHQGGIKDEAATYLESSVPHVGAGGPWDMGYDGEGIKVAVIDTGVDPWHPDLLTLGSSGNIYGKNFMDPGRTPVDFNGHGTQVAGVIAANGSIRGMAPGSTIYAYKVSHDGESVSSDLIVQAIKEAVADDADIINISLGVNRTNRQINMAINEATEAGVLVVVAAGNDGPSPGTIGSPGISPNAITVGATHNNLESSLVATLEVDGEFFEAIPMADTKYPEGAVTSPLAYGGYGRSGDFEPGSLQGKIALVERGSDSAGEKVYFSDKESVTASAGARALLVYNNVEGVFHGDLVHEFVDENYAPRIPAVSISKEDGLDILERLDDGATATLHIFRDPDTVPHFSSRGPVSPFYVKPDMVAPGVFVNSTSTDGRYEYVSGTSFATPHVSGAAALLLQKHSLLEPHEIKSILVTTTDQVSDGYGEKLPAEVSGSGRLNATRAFEAQLVVSPTFLTFNVAPQSPEDTQTLSIKAISGATDYKIDVMTTEYDRFDITHDISDGALDTTVRMAQDTTGKFQGVLRITHEDTVYNVPFIIWAARGSLTIAEDSGVLRLGVDAPEWSYARILVIDPKTGGVVTTSATPNRDAEVEVYQSGTYWIDATITSRDSTYSVYDKVTVVQPAEKSAYDAVDIGLPYRQMIILAAATAAVAIFGVVMSRRM